MTVETFLSDRNGMSESRKMGFPKWVSIWWWVSAPIALLFDLRILWEKTFLTWDQGPQMIGFSVAHTNPLFFMSGILCTYALLVWLVLSIVWLSIKEPSQLPSQH